MNPRLPSSVLMSTGLALILTVLYVLVQLLIGSAVSVGWGRTLAFAIGCFVLLMIFLESFLYRRLKNVTNVNQREIKKLKDMEAYRREFLGEVSHELKTPIFAVQGFIHTLMEGAMEDEKVRGKFLKKAMKNADRLSSLVEDLLIITQAESGEMELKISRFSIYDLVNDVLDTLEYKFTRKKRNITYRVVTNGHERTIVLADRERIQQVLTNLIDNAVKYGDAEGEVIIQLQTEQEKLFVSVTDQGPGIEEEHLEKIFRRFYRIDKSRSREKGGTGLGLAICKHLLKMHGEQIRVNSQIGEGTTFAFSLKIA